MLYLHGKYCLKIKNKFFSRQIRKPKEIYTQMNWSFKQNRLVTYLNTDPTKALTFDCFSRCFFSKSLAT